MTIHEVLDAVPHRMEESAGHQSGDYPAHQRVLVREGNQEIVERPVDGLEDAREHQHDLRHTVGTHALKKGRPIHEVSKMLGHKDPAMTLRRYAHVLEDMRDETALAMDELF